VDKNVRKTRIAPMRIPTIEKSLSISDKGKVPNK